MIDRVISVPAEARVSVASSLNSKIPDFSLNSADESDFASDSSAEEDTVSSFLSESRTRDCVE